jgi:hypothetical protein
VPGVVVLADAVADAGGVFCAAAAAIGGFAG